MRKAYFLIFKTLLFCLLGQSVQYGAEIYSQANYTYGRFEAVLSPSAKSGYITSFQLFADQNQRTALGFELSKNGSICYFLSKKVYLEDSLKQSTLASSYVIEWTPTSVKYFVDSQLALEIPTQDTPLTQPMKVGFTLWKRNKGTEVYTADTTLSELEDFKYHAYTATGFESQYTDAFDQLNTSYWTKSIAKYPDNVLQNDTNMLFVDKGKLQMIALGYKIKGYKRIFRRDKGQDIVPHIVSLSNETIKGAPCVVLSFSDSIYNVDKNVKNFEIDGPTILKSKLKSDYKTVILYLNKPLDRPSRLLYFPVRSRFRKPQVIKLP